MIHNIETKKSCKFRREKNYLNNLETEDYNCQKINEEIISSLEYQLKRVKFETQMEKIKPQLESIKLKLKPKFGK